MKSPILRAGGGVFLSRTLRMGASRHRLRVRRRTHTRPLDGSRRDGGCLARLPGRLEDAGQLRELGIVKGQRRRTTRIDATSSAACHGPSGADPLPLMHGETGLRAFPRAEHSRAARRVSELRVSGRQAPGFRTGRLWPHRVHALSCIPCGREAPTGTTRRSVVRFLGKPRDSRLGSRRRDQESAVNVTPTGRRRRGLWHDPCIPGCPRRVRHALRRRPPCRSRAPLRCASHVGIRVGARRPGRRRR
jgi:hypothetical protein